MQRVKQEMGLQLALQHLKVSFRQLRFQLCRSALSLSHPSVVRNKMSDEDNRQVCAADVVDHTREKHALQHAPGLAECVQVRIPQRRAPLLMLRIPVAIWGRGFEDNVRQSKHEPCRQKKKRSPRPIVALDWISNRECECKRREGSVSKDRAELHSGDRAKVRRTVHQVVHLINSRSSGQRDERPNSEACHPHDARTDSTIIDSVGALHGSHRGSTAWPRNEFTAAVGAYIVQLRSAGGTKRAFKGADVRLAIT